MPPARSTPPSSDMLLERFADILECPRGDLDLATVFRDHPHWDSLAALATIATLDSAFGVVVPHAEFERLRTIGDLASYLDARLDAPRG
jgi:acyl carrier protein